ncbi:hypothetical protein D3C86_2207680 [compost metagenome]
MALTEALNSLVGFLRTRLTVADGSPEPVIRPVAPLMTSMRSRLAESSLLLGFSP